MFMYFVANIYIDLQMNICMIFHLDTYLLLTHATHHNAPAATEMDGITLLRLASIFDCLMHRSKIERPLTHNNQPNIESNHHI